VYLGNVFICFYSESNESKFLIIILGNCQTTLTQKETIHSKELRTSNVGETSGFVRQPYFTKWVLKGNTFS